MKNPVIHARTKHIEVQHHFIREAAGADTIQVEYTPTDSQLADFLTKPLPQKAFVNNRHHAGVIPHPYSSTSNLARTQAGVLALSNHKPCLLLLCLKSGALGFCLDNLLSHHSRRCSGKSRQCAFIPAEASKSRLKTLD